jgi:hypothetical protein
MVNWVDGLWGVTEGKAGQEQVGGWMQCIAMNKQVGWCEVMDRRLLNR